MNTFNYETPYMDNTVVGFYGTDRVIVKQEDGALFYCDIPENLLTSISELTPDEQEEIRKQYADCEV